MRPDPRYRIIYSNGIVGWAGWTWSDVLVTIKYARENNRAAQPVRVERVR
jgi:hypothetical protein